MEDSPKINTAQCLQVQAFGLRACEEGMDIDNRNGVPDPRGDDPRPCPWYHRGSVICGGKEVRRLIRKGRYPRGGTPEARAYLEEFRKRPMVMPVPKRKVSSWRNVVSRIWSWVGRGGLNEPPWIDEGDH
jgi:hypothetical protein